MENRGFYFETKNNQYFYNDVNGNISQAHDGYKSNIVWEDKNYVSNNVNENEVKVLLNSVGIRQLILLVTEECNLRCKYCLYSGSYDNNRTHSRSYMNIDIAKEAIKKYLSSAEVYRKNNLLFKPTIGFFGGEPLLSFDLIKESVKYSKQIYSGKIYYTITTNATLLTEEIIDFLVENDFFLVISLNGNKYENDRLRVYADGRGTYESILKNMKLIHDKHPKYFNSNVNIATIFDNGTDMFKLKEFFDTNSLVKNKLTLLTKVIDTHTDWYDQYSNDINQKYNHQIKELKKLFFNQLSSNKPVDLFLKRLFSFPYFNIINRSLNQEIKDCKPSVQPFSGSCLPGMKVAVDYKGLLHMCEKINAKLPIGDVGNWIDYKKVVDIINKLNNVLGNHCINCPIQRLCPTCYKDIIDNNGNISLNLDLCKNLINIQRELFSEIYSVLESGTFVSEIEKNIV